VRIIRYPLPDLVPRDAERKIAVATYGLLMQFVRLPSLTGP
jgi:hypothetical protein